MRAQDLGFRIFWLQGFLFRGSMFRGFGGSQFIY